MVNNIQFVFEERPHSFLEGFEEGAVEMDSYQEKRNGKGRVRFYGQYYDYWMEATWKDGRRQGDATIFTPEGLVDTSLCYVNDEVNGPCSKRDHGKVVLRGTVKNGMIEGYCEEYNPQIRGFSIFEYKQGVRVAKMVRCAKDPRMIEHVLLDNNKHDVIGEYVINHDGDGISVKINGDAIFFDENEKPTSLCKYVDGTPLMKEKVFNGDMMTEFNNNGKKIYEGKFNDSIGLRYPRHGEGCEYNPLTERMIYNGSYDQNERTRGRYFDASGRLLYDGSWINKVPEGHGTLYSEQGVAMYESEWVNGYLYLPQLNPCSYCDFETREITRVYHRDQLSKWKQRLEGRRLPLPPSPHSIQPSPYPVQPSQYPVPPSPPPVPSPRPVQPSPDPIPPPNVPRGLLNEIPTDVTHLVIAANICNDANIRGIDFSRLTSLIECTIGRGCFAHAKSILFANLHFFRQLKIGSSCFSMPLRKSIMRPEGTNSFIIRNCESLETISIGSQSFVLFNEMVLDGLPLLQTLEIGNDDPSYCFTFADEFKLSNLSSLYRIKLGNTVFMQVKSVKLENLPMLSVIELEGNTLYGDQNNKSRDGRFGNVIYLTSGNDAIDLRIELPRLERIIGNNRGCLVNFGFISTDKLPKLQLLQLYDDFLQGLYQYKSGNNGLSLLHR